MLLSLLIAQLTFAQGNVLNIKGKVITGAGEAVDFAIVQLYDSDGRAILATTTDSMGRYFFTTDKNRSYILAASALGFITTDSVKTTLIEDTAYTVPDIVLQQDVQNLSNVTITGRKNLYEMKPDKLVMNIEGNAIAAGNSVFEVIRKAPAVSVDKEDNLKLKGAQAQIYIDGKPAFLSGQQLTNYLKNLPAGLVATIEIITQPSGKYEAAGLAGIINIKLKKNKAYGLNGSATLSAGVGRYPKLSGGLNLNYRKDKMNIYGSVSPAYSESYNRLNYNSIIESPATTIYQDRDNYWHPKTTWQSYNIGADYNIN